MSDKPNIYLVDDDAAIRQSAGFMLRTLGYNVAVFASGNEFLRRAKSVDLGCVLLDIRIPDVDGLEVQRKLIERGIEHPVVVLTGHGDVSIVVEAMKAGAIDFLEKPFERAGLLAALDLAFARLSIREAAHVLRGEAQLRIARLTSREQDVLRGTRPPSGPKPRPILRKYTDVATLPPRVSRPCRGERAHAHHTLRSHRSARQNRP